MTDYTRITFPVACNAVPLAEEAVAVLPDDLQPLSSAFCEIEEHILWQGELLYLEKPDSAALGDALAAMLGPVNLTVGALADQDWVLESQKSLTPVPAARFYVHSEFHKETVPQGAIPLLVEAGQAFGSGHHETTRGCLLAICDLARARKFRNPFDLGCGTGILAIGLGKLQKGPVFGSDIDPVAVRVARRTARENRLGHARFVTAAGFAQTEIRRRAPFDLIIANILARPLQALAPATARNLARGGYVILSGLLTWQETAVINAHRRQGLVFRRRRRLGDWSILILQKP